MYSTMRKASQTRGSTRQCAAMRPRRPGERCAAFGAAGTAGIDSTRNALTAGIAPMSASDGSIPMRSAAAPPRNAPTA